MNTEETQQISTEEKIKNAARQVFMQKGYAGARTREIAELADINLALLNYYFRSKEKLFSIIMLESLQYLVESIKNVINNPATDFEYKVEHIVANYIHMLQQNPEIPLFIINEIKTNPQELFEKMKIKNVFEKSVFLKQYVDGIQKGIYKEIHPIHLLLNVLGLTLFPFIARPLISKIIDINDTQFLDFMEERKQMIPEWVINQIRIKN